MNPRLTESLLVGGAVLYLLALGWSIVNLDYDTWGALVVIPPLAVLGVLIMRRMFPGDLRRVGTIMSVGLFVKFGGAAARHWVGFEAYQGAIDARRYHDYAVDKVTAVWSGEAGMLTLIPQGTGTPFQEEMTAVIYSITGVSLLGGFMVFAWLAYLGTAWFVKAACVAIPGFAQSRYAVLVILAPSIVYWPASIGKEAWMFLTLGFATYGIARLFAGLGFVIPVAITGVGLLAAAMVRPHMAGLWMVGVLPALVVALFGRKAASGAKRSTGERVLLGGVIAIAAGGFAIAAGATMDYLDFEDEEGAVTATSIIEETVRRTEQAGSNFDPPSVSNPANWPYASIRTLTRPLIIEARGSGQLLSALEMSVLIGIAAVSWRRLANLPRQLVTVPFVTFAMTVLFFGSLAFTSFANLGVLTRQRTLLFPFLLLLLCLPQRRRAAPDDPEVPVGVAAPVDRRDPVGVGARAELRTRPSEVVTPEWQPTVGRATRPSGRGEWARSTPSARVGRGNPLDRARTVKP